ncbi:hypothetical protein [Epilithonimonas xixisoli]|uniref:Uncharacterized protein n=1 Tax=Epilithonimonas xixisoli TaxID=1476462 RepID=A0A4R8ICQ8_9FLAO|nr:hypothetical protein [Epilithonimonas xixisoli]TDX82869.1 hypothetical protein B0I22_2909 [Epilithonimonas xixisoli]
MKKRKSTSFTVIGLLFVVSGSFLFEDNEILRYSFLILGILMLLTSIYLMVTSSKD